MQAVSWLFCICVATNFIGRIVCPPVDQKKPNQNHGDGNDASVDDLETGVEYNRYLQEVVQLLESDPDFRGKLEKSDPEDIRSGKVAKELEYVNHHVRNKLDELKRQEMERLRHLAIQEYERARGLGIPHDGRPNIPQHLDHRSPRFETEDLRKLIVQTTKDLEEADRKRKESFKEYEMQKEFEHQSKLKELPDEESRKAEEKRWEESQKKHAQHPKMHHPGSKQQYEEVWEEQDHLDPNSFNPKTFFALHDLDGNGVWDADEVKALFSKELDKVYDPNAPEDDMAERYEEMERMREHVFNETDTNRDYLISFPEFLEQTRKQEFERDPGWNTIEEQPVYTHEEYMEFERQRQAEIQRMIQQGLLPPHPGMMHPNAMPYGMPPQQPMPGQYGVPQMQQPYYPPPPVVPPQQSKQITPEEGARLQQQQQYGQVQYAQQPYAGQPQQFAQQQQQPYIGQAQQAQFVQQPPLQQGYPQQPVQGVYQPQMPAQQIPAAQQPVQQPAVQQQEPARQQPAAVPQAPVQQPAQQQKPVADTNHL